jgi:hypothetical protein
MNTDVTLNEPVRSVGPESMTPSSIQMKNEKVKNYLDIITLIRSIQRAEGNPDCFLKGNSDCDQLNCAWRAYCLGKEWKE